MIEGFRIDIASGELKDHLLDRAQHHEERAQFYGSQVVSLRAGGVGQKDVTNDPVSSLERSRGTHVQRSGTFQFLADHIVPNEIYRLQEHDLSRLELVGRDGL